MRLILLSLLLLSACREASPPAPTAAENAALDDTEAMLNELAANEAGRL